MGACNASTSYLWGLNVCRNTYPKTANPPAYPNSLTCFNGQFYDTKEFLLSYLYSVRGVDLKEAAQLVFFADRIVKSCNYQVGSVRKNTLNNK